MKEFNKNEIEKSERTLRFLLCISHHLSSRKGCRRANYGVTISENKVVFYPCTKVYPSRYHRKKENAVGIIEHVILHHFYDSLYDHVDDTGELIIKFGSLVSGRYIYESSLDNKQRRWNKVI